MKLLRGVVLGFLGLGLAFGAPTHGFTIHSPIALVADDAQMASRLHASLGRRFTNIVLRGSIAEARAEAGTSGGPEIAIVVATTRDRGAVTAYGSSLQTCHVLVNAQVLRLPAASLQFSKASQGKGPDCAVALQQADARLADDLMKSLEEFRRHGANPDREFLWVQLADDWPEAELAELRANLLQVPGIRTLEPDPDGHLMKMEVYRDPRSLAREMQRLGSVRVSRIAGRRITLSATGSFGGAAPSSSPPPAPTASPVRRQPIVRPVTPPPSTVQTASRSTPPPELRLGRMPSASGNRWAMVVGIARYEDSKLDLETPANDAQAFASVLRDPAVGGFPPDNVFVLLDNQATTKRIKMELDYLAHQTKPEDLFLFFFSSHGSPGSKDLAGDAYLITHDTDIKNLYATAFPMHELRQALSQRIKAQTVVGFLDACHAGQVENRSGGGFQGSKGLTFEAEEGAVVEGQAAWLEEWQTLSNKSVPAAAASESSRATGNRVVIIASSAGDQLSWESPTLGHGIFTYYLMDALKRSEGQATVSSLFNYVRGEVKEAVQAEYGRIQEPYIVSNADTDFSIRSQPN